MKRTLVKDWLYYFLNRWKCTDLQTFNRHSMFDPKEKTHTHETLTVIQAFQGQKATTRVPCKTFDSLQLRRREIRIVEIDNVTSCFNRQFCYGLNC